MKRVVIVHGFKGRPETNWKPWLKNELEQAGVTVSVPEMPNTENPIANDWVRKLSEVVGEADSETYFVGHSLGCITILRYLEFIPKDVKIGGCVFVAGFTGRFEKYWGGHDSFFDYELDWAKIKSHCDNFIAIQSSDDENVEVNQLTNFERKLGATAVRVEGMGHFGSADGVFEVPLVFDQLKQLMA